MTEHRLNKYANEENLPRLEGKRVDTVPVMVAQVTCPWCRRVSIRAVGGRLRTHQGMNRMRCIGSGKRINVTRVRQS